MDALINYFREVSAFGPNAADWWLVGIGGATLFLLIITAAFAGIQIWHSGRTTKKNNSFFHIAIQTRDHDLIQMFEQFRLARRKLRDGHIGSFGVEQVDEREISYAGKMLMAEDVLKKVFNYYEATAIGIKNGALNEPILKDWWRRSYVLDFIDFALYVYQRRLRDGAEKLFSEYELQAINWAEDDEKQQIEDAQAKARSWWREEQAKAPD
ncbi:DUF4760 domain-containing protein [Oceanicaulis sp.]|uniref:DUF4760 domain-containing protein n=1 Tax=Oceanicaulis sp. TaxID=1924941 RepID=UPI003BA87335